MTGPRLRFVRPDERQAPAAPSAPTPTPTPAPAPPALQVGNRGLVLHAAWLPPAGTGEHWLALWAEVETEPPKRHRSLTRLSDELQPRSHPFGARYSELVRATERLWKLSRPGVRPRSRTTQMRQELWLPALGTRPLPSPELVRAGWAEDPALYADDLTALPLAIWRTDALWLDAESAGTLLAGLPHLVGAEIAAETETHTPPGYSAVGRTFAPRLIFGSDLRFWIAASKMTLDLLVRQRFLPGAMVVQGSSGYYGYGYGPSREMLASVWYAAFSDPADRARFTALVSAMPPLCRAGITPGLSYNRDEILTAHALLEDFTHIVVSKRIQQWLQQEGIYLSSRSAPDSGRTPSRYDFGYYGPGSLATRWLGGLSTPLQPIHLREGEIDTLMSGIGRWQSGLGGIGASTFRLCFRLTPPLGPLADESEAEPELVEAGAAAEAAMQAPRLVIVPDEDSAAQHNGHTSTPAPRVVDLPSPEADGHDPEAAQAAQAAQEDALATLDTGGTWRLEYLLQARDDPSLLVPLEEVWPETGATARFLDRRFDHPQAQVLAGLHQAGRLFAPIATSLEQRHPLGCDLSGRLAYDFLRESVPLLEEAGFGVLVPSWWKRAAPRPAMRLRLRGPKKTSTGLMGLDAVVSYDWKLALGDQELTKEELERLVALKEPLVRLRGQWVELRPDQVSAALEFVRAHPTGRMSLGEALRTSLTGETADGQIDVEEVRADAWIGDLIGRLASGDGVTEVPPPANLHGVLRPYQGRGLSWLTFLSRYGLGACLADDMGLGKCITGESLISTVLGPRTIGSLWQACIADGESDGDGGEWGTLVQPVLVNSFDGGEIICRPVRRIYRQRIAEPCRTVSLADGSRLSSTRRHRYLTPTGWKLAGELQVGDLVAVAGKTPYVGANEMPAELAELMAWQLAEGYEFDPHHNGRFHNSDQGVLNRFRDLARQCGINLPEPYPTRTTMCICTNRLYHLFQPWGYEWGHKSAGKVVPQSVLEAPLETQQAFIAAMMDAEGHIGKTHCEITMASEQAIHALQSMLRNFGVWGRIRLAMKAATTGLNIKRPYYTLTFGGNSVPRFLNNFTLRIPYKQEALVRLAGLPHNSNVEGVPTQAVVAAMRERKIPLRSVGLRTVYEWQGMGLTLATSVAIQLRAKGHPDLARQIDDLAAPGIHWCKVKEIAEFQHEGYVYDLQVPDTHNYIANGIITHNTVELLSLLLHLKNAGQLPKPVLLVCPTSVVGNWRHESARFAPDLRVLIHHGATRVGRAASERFAREVADQDLVVTTYSLLPRDEKILAGADWGGVVLDEAQNIKNVEAKQSQAARKLTAPLRVALTGTPVENRLSELWSIMDFLNPGYLGSYRRFHEQLAGPIEQLRDQHATARLQTLVRPFVLRRLKTDPTVISDLPEKIEMKEYVPLSREQVTLYEAVVRDGLRQIEGAEGDMARRGVILAMLSKLKQVCNHPAHFLGDGSQLEGRSGKLTRLEELIEELLGEGDRALIFTQFTGMGDRLQPYLQERFGVEVLYLHGGVPQQARERLVGRFQSADGPPLFLLSLKAGGTGLNLTQANHVIHFDRWWNPAVENQATDRAFRIGQTRNVQVRKFVCTGTLEERIDAMIEQKRELAESVIGTGEGWITEMTTEELRDLFSLRSDALAD